MWTFFCLSFGVCVFCTVADETNEKYIEIDGIQVLKVDYDNNLKEREKAKKMKSKKLSEFKLESQLEEKEDLKYSQKLPKLCHACRLFVEGFMDYLHENGTVKEKRDSKHPLYVYDEHLAYDAYEEICYNMKRYAVTRIAEFRYTKGVSILRQVFNEAQKDSKVNEWMYNEPQEQIDDPTGEIRRLQEKCNTLRMTHWKKLLEWFESYQQESLMDWFCKKRYLKNRKQVCLNQKKLSDKANRKINVKFPKYEL